jgi:uncharacterized membrane protein YcjF (UPF0283 family)
MEPYIIPKDWLVGIALLGVGVGLVLPLAQRGDWIGWVAVVVASLMAIPVFVFICCCCYFRLRDFVTWLRPTADDELEP